MRFLEFRDMNNILQVIPLLRPFFQSVSYSLDNEIQLANLITTDNKILSIVGTDFKIVTYKK